MKNIITAFLLASLIFGTGLFAATETGVTAPGFTLTDSTGTEHSLSDFAGKYVVLEWTNHQCPFVVKHYKKGDMQALQEAMTGDGVVWLQIVSSAEGKQGYLTPAQAETLRASKYLPKKQTNVRKERQMCQLSRQLHLRAATW